MKKLPWSLPAVLVFALIGCTGGAERDTELNQSPLAPGVSEETPIDERISDLLQESKQQYDDGHYVTSMRMAEQATALITEHRFPAHDMALAITIQGYCLLQMGRIDDYFIKDHGMQSGAITKFREALRVRPKDFRAQLGIGLAQFRRHGEHVRKAEVLGEGIILLESLRSDFVRGAKASGTAEGDSLVRDAGRRFKTFRANRGKLVELKYIFRDPLSVEYAVDGHAAEPAWLGSDTEAKDALHVNDMGWIIDDALSGASLSAGDITTFDRAAEETVKSWQKVRRYWRLKALRDVQDARDRFLSVRKTHDQYFWVDRDLAFTYQSLGAFFLDGGLERARMMAIAEGLPESAIEPRAREIYLSDDFKFSEKHDSKQNYVSAHSFIRSFVERHRAFEDARTRKVATVSQVEENSNPFLVDLVARYRATMDELIQEERNMRKKMILEAAALCIDPLFQINDIEMANLWANQIKAIDPGSPIHHFVSATAYYAAEDWELALDNYRAFMDASSITEDANRRAHARSRIFHCEQQIRRSAGAGQADGTPDRR